MKFPRKAAVASEYSKELITSARVGVEREFGLWLKYLGQAGLGSEFAGFQASSPFSDGAIAPFSNENEARTPSRSSDRQTE